MSAWESFRLLALERPLSPQASFCLAGEGARGRELVNKRTVGKGKKGKEEQERNKERKKEQSKLKQGRFRSNFLLNTRGQEKETKAAFDWSIIFSHAQLLKRPFMFHA
jgi:hypothetical protein